MTSASSSVDSAPLSLEGPGRGDALLFPLPPPPPELLAARGVVVLEGGVPVLVGGVVLLEAVLFAEAAAVGGDLDLDVILSLDVGFVVEEERGVWAGADCIRAI